ncbi:MAG: proline dehydrogenase [Saprospiraceae bacterium]|nr:proline dehydrogenase [Saprospiraceae bacterium]
MSQPSFENTDIAFKSRSDRDLLKAYWLFRMIGMPWLVNLGAALLKFAMAIKLPVKWALRPTIFKQFVGGESIEEAAVATKVLDEYGIGTILDYSVEGKEEEEAFEAVTQEIIQTLNVAEGNPHIPFCVFKVSGLASNKLLERINDRQEKLDPDEKAEMAKLKDRVSRICERANEVQKPLLIDAEESWIQDVIDRLAMKTMQEFNKEKAIIYNTIQLYRHDRLEYLKQSHQIALEHGFKYAIKLVRGAYMEKERERAEEMGYPSPIQPDKAACDRDFNEAIRYCIEHNDTIALVSGSHNEESALLLTDLMEKNNISVNHPTIYFAQLFGMSDHISFNLSNAGYNVAKYVPYGPVKEVVPYLIRRARENTSVEGQTGRELSLILKERKRRNS